MNDSLLISPLNPDLPTNSGEQRYWRRLYGSSKALALNSAADTCQVPLVVITADLNSTNQLREELLFFRRNDKDTYPLLTFPDWETLPYDLFSPYQDIISERLATLVQLPLFTDGILIVPVSTLMHRLMPKSYLTRHSLMLQNGQELVVDDFRHELRNSGYRFVSQVMEHGDVAIRG